MCKSSVPFSAWTVLLLSSKIVDKNYQLGNIFKKASIDKMQFVDFLHLTYIDISCKQTIFIFANILKKKFQEIQI